MNNFDLLRFIAAFQVLLLHANLHLKIDNQYFIIFIDTLRHLPGVPIFFLISGYLISKSYNRCSNLGEYFKNRLLRIYPALYVNILLSTLILFYFDFLYFDFEFVEWLIAQLTIIQFYNPDMFRGFGVGVINGSLWTISVELSFYFLLPILIHILKKNKIIIIIIFILSFLIWNYNLNSQKDIFYNKVIFVSIIPYLFFFLIGIYFDKFEYLLYKFIENKFVMWLLIYIAFNNIFEYQNFVFYYVLKWFIFSFLVFSFAFSYKMVSYKIFKNNDYTYGLYIYHMLVINIFIHYGLQYKLQYLLYVVSGSFFMALLSWHFIEKPMLKYKKFSIHKIQ